MPREAGTAPSQYARLMPPSVDLRLPAHLLDYFRSVGTQHHLPKGALLEKEGEEPRAFWILLKGRLQIYSTDATGKQITLNTVLPEESVGETVVAQGPRTSSVRATADSVAIEVSIDQFTRALELHPDFSLLLITRLAYLVRGLCDRVRALALSDVYARIVRLLLDSSEVQGPVRIAPRLSNFEIARRVGASRSMVSRVMGSLVSGGYVELGSERMTISKAFPERW